MHPVRSNWKREEQVPGKWPMRRMAKLGYLALLMAVFQTTAVLGGGVHAWMLPKGKHLDPKKSDTWETAEPGSSPADGVAIGNDRLLVTLKPGEPGPVLYTRTGKRRLPLAVLPDGKTPGRITRVKITTAEQSEAVVQLTTGAAEAELKLSIGRPYVEVKPVKNANSIDIGMNARYTLLPDFFGDDVVFDPAKFKADTLTVPAENFLLNLLEEESGILMCVWQGTLTLGKEMSRGDGPDPRVDLILSGQGPARRIKGARIEFLGKPVYVSVLEHANLWHDVDVSSWTGYKPTPVKWKRPFDAKWCANFVVAEGQATRDWHTRSQSFDFRGPTKKGDKPWWTRKQGGSEDRPVIWQEASRFMVYPCSFKNEETRLCLYADMAERRKAEGQTGKARKQNKEAPAVYPPNIYDKVIIYCLDRASETPMTVFTPVDIMRNTLGQGPCEYVLDLEGVKPRLDGGTRKLLAGATCGLWEKHIYPISLKTRKLKDGEKLPEKTYTHLMHAMEDMALFIKAVHDRIREYKKWGRDTAGFCEAEAGKSAKVKPLATDILTYIQMLNKDVGRTKFEGRGTEGHWLKRVKELSDEFNAGNYKNIGQMGGIRSLGSKTDKVVARCRRYVKGARQAASLADVSDPEVAAFAAAVRKRCQAILRNKHPKEGL